MYLRQRDILNIAADAFAKYLSEGTWKPFDQCLRETKQIFTDPPVQEQEKLSDQPEPESE